MTRLDDVALCLRVHGWCQGFAFEPQTNHMCILGAITTVAKPGELTELFAAACRAIGYENGESNADLIVGWNDTPGRTFDEVLAVLETPAVNAVPTPPAARELVAA